MISDNPPRFDIGDKVLCMVHRRSAMVTGREFELMSNQFKYQLRFNDGTRGSSLEKNLSRLRSHPG